jgi:outer membrane protein X
MARSLTSISKQNPTHMRTIIPLVSFLLIAIFASGHLFAQDDYSDRVYKKFKVDGAMGWARPSGAGKKTGVLLSFEPKYNVTDNIAVGLRTELTAMARGNVNISGTQLEGKAGVGLSFLPTADVYFTQTLARPFAGGGAGIYNLLSLQASTGDGGTLQIPAVTKFGGMIRGGVEVWHIRAAVEYNFVGKSGGFNNNYLGLKIGLVFGGGKHNNDEGY